MVYSNGPVMNITVIGCPSRKFKPYVIRAIDFYAKKLLPSKILRENVDLEVHFKRELEAFAYSSVEGYNSSSRPREFLIEIHSGIGAKNIFKSLAHEMVHIKQYIRGETNASLSKWHGVEVDQEKIDYYEQPWEVEAYGWEEGLFNGFVNEEQLWKIFGDISNPNTKVSTKKINWRRAVAIPT